MRFGMTYDLRQDYLAEGLSAEETAEFDKPDTIDAIEDALQELGHEVERIGNHGALLERLIVGERWDMVFNIAEGLHGMGREAQVPAALDAYRIPYVFSDPLVLSLTLHKAMAKHVVRDCGVPTPDFALVQCEEDLNEITLPFPLFAKPVAEGTGKGVSPESKVENPNDLRRTCLHLLQTFQQPVLVETYLPGREVTVGIVGTGRQAEALGVLEVVLKSEAESEGYTFYNKENYEGIVDYRLVDGAIAEQSTQVALAAWRALGCRDGGRLDIRLSEDGIANFLEVNPLAGLNPIRSDFAILCRLAGIGYNQLIARIVDSACQREGLL